MKVWISAGEPSGDRWGAGLAQELKKLRPDVELSGMGGPGMKRAGVAGFGMPLGGVMGIAGPLRKIRELRARLNDTVQSVRRTKPDVIVVIDYPDFHMRFLKQVDVPRVVYLIPPQVWAWRKNRAKRIAALCTDIVTMFSWERRYYTPWMDDRHVHWFGHPLVDGAFPGGVLELQDDVKRGSISGPVALLPGSREREIRLIAPVMEEMTRTQGVEAVYAVESEDSAQCLRDVTSESVAQICVGRTADVLRQARSAVVCAGTATLEAACTGLPLVIVYKTDRLTYRVAEALVNVRYCGLPNLILSEEHMTPVYPELIQNACTAERLTAALAQVSETPRDVWRTNGQAIRRTLGAPGFSHRAAELVLGV